MGIKHLQKEGDFYPQARAAEEAGHSLEDVTFFYVRAWVDVQDKIVTILGENVKARIPVIMREILPIRYSDILEIKQLSGVKVPPEQLPDNTFKNIPTYKGRL